MACLTPEQLKDKAEEYSKALTDAGYDTLPKQIEYFVKGGERTKEQLMHLAPYVKDAYKKLNPSIDTKAIDDFNIAKHIKTISDLQKADNRIAKEASQSSPISEPTAKWMNHNLDAAGLKDVGVSDMTTATKVHESGKSWVDWTKEYAADIYQQGLELAKSDSVGIQRAIDAGAKSEQEILDSVLSKYVSDMSDHPLDNIPKEIWTSKLFDAAKNHIENTTKAKLPDGFQYESIDNLAGRINNALTKEGRGFSSLNTIDEIIGVENDTTNTRFEINGNVVSQNDFKKFIPHSEGRPAQHIMSPNFSPERNLRMGIKDAVLSAIDANDPNLTPREAIKSKLSSILGDIIKSTGREGNPNDKSFTLDLKPAKEKLDSNKFNKDLQVMADQIAEKHTVTLQDGTQREVDGRIDMYATDESGTPLYSQEFRKMYGDMIKHNYQKAYIEENERAVILDEKHKIADEEVKGVGNDISTFRKAILDKIGNHPRLVAAYDWADKNFFSQTEHLNGWAKNFTGKAASLLNDAVKGMTGADGSVGREAVYQLAFDRAVEKLYKSDWIRKGSAEQNPNAKITELETRLIAGVPVTTAERLDIYLQSQRGNSAEIWYGKGDTEEKQKAREEMGHDTLPEKTGMTFTLERKIDGREAKEVLISYGDYKEMEAEFSPHMPEVRDGWGKGSNHLLTVVNPVHKLLNGIELAPPNDMGEVEESQEGVPEGLQKEPKKQKGIYYPHSVSGGEKLVYDKQNTNRYIDDIQSHKTYTPSDNVKMVARDFYKTIQKYRDGNAKYAAWAIPMRNVDNILRANEQTIKDLGLEHKVDWWVNYKKNVFNPPNESVLGKTGNGMMANFVLSRLGLNPFVSFEQLTAIPLAVNTIPSKYLFRARKALGGAVGKSIVNNEPIYQEMNTHSSYALYRNTKGNSEVQRAFQTSNPMSIDILNKGLKKIFGSDKYSVNKDDLLNNIQVPDKAIGAQYWTAAKMMANDEGLFEHGNTAIKFWERVSDLHEQAITESQHSSDDAHRSMLATKNDIISKSLSLFGSQKIAAFNGFHSRVIDYISDPSKENLDKMVKQGFNVFVTNAALSATINTGRFMLLGSAGALALHKPEEVYQESFMKDLANNIPGAAPIVDLVYSKYKMGAYGHDFSYPVFEIINDYGKTTADAIHAINDGTKQKQVVSDFIYSISEGSGIPLQPILAAKKLSE